MATNFCQVDLAHIEEGDFIKECDEQFRDMQSKLINFVKTHDRDSDATLVVKIKLQSNQKQSYFIITDIEQKLPRKPVNITTALPQISPADGEPCLFAQQTGTHEFDPHQLTLTTKDGRTVDKNTGEITQ